MTSSSENELLLAALQPASALLSHDVGMLHAKLMQRCVCHGKRKLQQAGTHSGMTTPSTTR